MTQQVHVNSIGLPWQVGDSSDHTPLSRHSLVSYPMSLYPSLQLYVAMDPTVFPVTVITPLLRDVSVSHLTIIPAAK